jgi:Flp pilus assembly pilin Flp
MGKRQMFVRMRDDEGNSVVEYALLVALILLACLAVLTSFGDENSGLINGSASSIVDGP